MKNLIVFSTLFISFYTFSQEKGSNSDTRNFIDNAEITQVNKDWNEVAEFKSGLAETVAFFPVEAINLKSKEKVNALQMDMDVLYNISGKNYRYFKSSWIDLEEIDEFINFIEQYIIPNIDNKTDKRKSTTYIFNSKEIVFHFRIEKNKRRISIYLKDYGSTDYDHYFWTESQVNNIPKLLEMLKKIK